MRKIAHQILPLTVSMGALAIGCSSTTVVDDPDLRPRLRDAVEDASISLSQAIDIAEGEASGVPTRAELEVHLIGESYKVDLVDLAGNQKTEVEIDPESAEVEEVDTESADDDDLERAEIVAESAVTLKEAVDKAERAAGGQAYNVEVEVDDGVFNVQVLAPDDIVDVRVSTEDGTVLDANGPVDRDDAGTEPVVLRPDGGTAVAL
jgi:uncharacterized membrane protein YkoI